MSVYSLACPTVGCYQNFQCDPEFQNKIIAIAYVKKSAASSIDKSTPQDWIDSLFQAMLDGEGYLVFNTSGEKPKPDTATTTGRGMQNTKALAKTHTLTYQDMQGIIASNIEFYNQILGTSQLYDFYYFTPNRIWDASGSYITVIGDPVITAELNTYQMADVVVTWISKYNPLPSPFDTNIFLEGLYFDIQLIGGGTPDDSFTASISTSIVNPNEAVLNQSGLTAGTVVWGLQDGATPVPNGWTINPTSGAITLDATTGTFFVTMTATNASGCVFGTLDITIVVS
jgi:hypothetical protein